MTVTETPQLDQRALALGAIPDEIAEERPSHLRVAPRVSNAVLRRRRRARFAVLGVAAISAASMFLLVTFHVFAVQSAFQLDKLDHELATQQRRYSLLRDQVARSSSPEMVASGAARLGMVRPLTVTPLHIEGVGWPGTAAFPVPPQTPYAPLDTPPTGP